MTEDPRIQTIREGLRYLQRYSTFNTTPALAALDSLAADLEAAREALEEIAALDHEWTRRGLVGWTPCGVARAALARLSTEKEAT